MNTAPLSPALVRTLLRFLSRLLLPVAFLPAPAARAQVVTQGTIAIGAGSALLDGDRPAFQETFRQRKDGVAGLDEFQISRSDDASLFRLEARLMPADDDYRATARFEKFDAFFIEAGFRGFRTYSDGSGGRFLPRNLSLSSFDEALELNRGAFHLEIGTLVPDRLQWRLRYDRATRAGTKSSLRWGASDLPGAGFGQRSFLPSYLVVEEDQETVTLEASRSTAQSNWKLAGRAGRTHVRHRHVTHRNVTEPDERYDVQRQRTRSDAVSGHGSYERVLSEKLRLSAGGLATTIDTNLSGSRAYGATSDTEFSPTAARRQNGDAGFWGLTGHAWLRQYLGNANAHYQATKHLSLVGGLKYERLRLGGDEAHSDFDTEQVRPPGGRGPATLVTTSVAAAGDSRDIWNEVTEDLELRHTGAPTLQLSLRGQWKQGAGTLLEHSTISGARAPVIDRDSDYERIGQRYDATATWFARPGLTLAANYTYRLKTADQTARRDNTSNAPASGNRYPVFIMDSRLESHDAGLRLSWRPRSNLTLVSRYSLQAAATLTTFAGLQDITSGRLRRHIFTQTATWNASPRLFVTAAANATFDQLSVPANPRTFNGDNNYVTASLGAGYAAGKVTDLFLDLSHYRADNYTDNPAITMPFAVGQTLQTAFVTWVRRQTDRLVYTVRYGVARNRDGTFGGLNDFDAQMLYAKVHYKF